MTSTAARWVAVAAICRRFGVTWIWDKGWSKRGRGALSVLVFVLHHTASSTRSGDTGALGLVRNGASRGLPNALSNVHLSRSGVIRMLARLTAWHAGAGSWRGIAGNSRAAGCEWENNGVGERATPQALHAYVVLAAAICHVFGLSPARVCGHKEWTPRKIDPRAPNFPSMPTFRRNVEKALQAIRTPPKPPTEDDMTYKRGGSYGNRTRLFKQLLNADIRINGRKGYDRLVPSSDTFGPKMEARVKQFQRDYDITPVSGEIGPVTLAWLLRLEGE